MKLADLTRHFSALSLRERVLAVAALIGVLFFIVEMAWVSPKRAEAKMIQARLAQQKTEIAALSNAVRAVGSAPRNDPQAQQRTERDALRATVDEAEAVVRRASSEVRMGEVIRTLVARTPGLALVSLKSLPSEAVYKSEKPGAMSALYRHGVEVAVQGQYATLIAYMQALERAIPNLLWVGAKLDVQKHPDSALRIAVYTLSVHPDAQLE